MPYLPFDTFKNFVDTLSGGRPLPPRIDRSLMSGMAGGTQTLLLGTLSTFGLIGDNRQVLPTFVELVRADEEGRRRVMAGLLNEIYPEAMKLAEDHATADQLAENFRVISGYQGSTLRKAITFFLNMAKYAQVELSPFFRAPAQNTGGRRPAARRGRPVAPTPTSVTAGPTDATASAMESRSIGLVSGGSVVISCSVSFLSLSRDDRDFVFDLVDKLDAYRQSHPDAGGAPASAAATPSVTDTG